MLTWQDIAQGQSARWKSIQADWVQGNYASVITTLAVSALKGKWNNAIAMNTLTDSIVATEQLKDDTFKDATKAPVLSENAPSNPVNGGIWFAIQ